LVQFVELVCLVYSLDGNDQKVRGFGMLARREMISWLVKFVGFVGLVEVIGEIYGNYKEVRRPGVLAGSQEIRKTHL
jgi:hypothetical protein